MRGWILGAALGLAAAAPAADDGRDRLAAALAPLLKKPPAEGLLVYEVLPRMQAEKAGLRVGDILTHYDGKPVRTAGQLQGLARAAAHENRGNLLVVAQRGTERLEATFDAAPMGLRFVAVNPAESRVLRRPATPYQPDWEPLRRQAATRYSFGFLVFGDKPIGWTRSYLQELETGKFVLRTQSYAKAGAGNPERRDSVVVFVADRPTLRPLVLRGSTDNKPALAVALQGSALRGERFGIPESAPLPDDALAAELVGFVAASMPRAKGACLHCSYLPAGALAAAPFADLCCLGPENVFDGRSTVSCFRYDQTEFGRSMAHVWIDPSGQMIKARLGAGMDYYRAGSADVGKAFPQWANEFPPIERLPELAGLAERSAN